MIGMILCGGYGKRFRPLTDTTPKVMLEIKDGYSILDRQLFAFGSAGFDRVFLLAGYLSEKIEEKYGSEYKGLKIEYVVEEKPLGTLNAIRMGMEMANEDVMVSNGDVVTDLNLKSMRQAFQGAAYPASTFVVRMRSPYGVVELGNGYIKSFKEKPLLNYFINGGFYCFSKDVLGLLEEFKVGDVEKTAFPRLAAVKQLAYYRESVPFWTSVDSPKDLENVKKEYENRTDKPWGYEKIINLTNDRFEKELFIMGGYRTSIHYHEQRDETLNVLSGSGYVEFKERKVNFKKRSKIRMKPNAVHSVVAAENTVLHEVSTPHPDDSVRVKDFYTAR
jgi:NDP-sugar pyrophosphorylase family protein